MLEVLYEDNHLLAVNKPPGLPTQGAAAGERSLVTLAREYIKTRYAKPGNVYLGIVSRLDSGTSGVVLLARTSKAAARLTELFRTRTVEKTYWALVAGMLEPASGELSDWLIKDEARQRMVVTKPNAPGAKQAELRYRRLRTLKGASFVEIELLTGRKHQIRVQLARRGFPVLGETKYAQAPAWRAGMALHARRLALEHPVRKIPLELVAEAPVAWRSFGIE